MSSTGNDIVSLNAIDIARTLQPRFYSKILAASEVAAYDQYKGNISFENFVWLSWSIKESAYKFLQRENPNLVFSPTRCIVSQIETPAEHPINDGSITVFQDTGFDNHPVFKTTIAVGAETLYSRSIMNSDFIFSVVNRDNDFEDTAWGIKRIDNTNSDNQSAEVRAFLLAKLKSDILHDLQIAKNDHGCPVLVNGEFDIPISLAHHGHWVGYSYQPNSILA